MNREKRFLANSFVYLLTSIISQLINILLIPIYTNNLTTAEFGQYNIISSVQSLLSILITLGIFSGLCRFFNEYQDKNNLKNVALTFSIFWGSICIIIGSIFSENIANLAFEGDTLGSAYVIYIIINSVICCIISIYQSYFSMEFKALKSSIIVLGQVTLMLLSTYVFLEIFKSGIIGVLRAQLITYILVLTVVLILDMKNIRLCFQKKKLGQMLRYGLGLAPGQVSAWVLTLVDRYFIKGMINLSAVGIYSMGYKIGMLIEPLFLNPFRNAFTPYKLSVYKEKHGKEKIRNLFNYFNFIGWLVILALSIYSDILIKILSTKEYNDAYKIVFIIAFSYFLWGLGEFYALGLHIANKMLLNSVVVTICAALNVGLNFVLIPVFGIYGAAISTTMAYLSANIFYYYIGKKYYNLHINLWEPYKYGGVFVLIYGIYLVSRCFIKDLVVQFFMNIILCSFYISLSISLGFISYGKVSSLFGKVKEKFVNKVCTKAYAYRLSLSDFEEPIFYMEEFHLKRLTINGLDKMVNVYDEIDKEKYNILKERIEKDICSGYVVVDKCNTICGYFNMTTNDVHDECINHNIKVEKGTVYLFDDYTFEKFRGKGVQQFSIMRRLEIAKKRGNKSAIVDILAGNEYSERSYMKFGFEKYMQYRYYHILEFKKTSIKELNK